MRRIAPCSRSLPPSIPVPAESDSLPAAGSASPPTCLENPLPARTTKSPEARSRADYRKRRIRPSLLSVDFVGRNEARFGNLLRPAVPSRRTEKARAIAFMAGRPHLLHLDEQRVAIAIKRDVHNRLGVPAAFAFHPKLLP